MDTIEIIKIITPLVIIELGLKIYCLMKLKNDEIKYFSKTIWIGIILLFTTFGPIAYLAFGRVKD